MKNRNLIVGMVPIISNNYEFSRLKIGKQNNSKMREKRVNGYNEVPN